MPKKKKVVIEGQDSRTIIGDLMERGSQENRAVTLAEKRQAVIDEAKELQWYNYMENLRIDATKPGAPANVRELYAKLMGKLQDKEKDKDNGLKGSDIARAFFALGREQGMATPRMVEVPERL